MLKFCFIPPFPWEGAKGLIAVFWRLEIGGMGLDNTLPPPGQYCVYALVCEDGSIYIGQTNDLGKRFRQHQAGSAARWTKKHRPTRILHFELVGSLTEAMRLERQWKTGKGRYRLRKMANEANPSYTK